MVGDLHFARAIEREGKRASECRSLPRHRAMRCKGTCMLGAVCSAPRLISKSLDIFANNQFAPRMLADFAKVPSKRTLLLAERQKSADDNFFKFFAYAGPVREIFRRRMGCLEAAPRRRDLRM